MNFTAVQSLIEPNDVESAPESSHFSTGVHVNFSIFHEKLCR